VKLAESNNLCGILLITAELEIVTIIFPSGLTLQLFRITVDHLCGFGSNGSTADRIMSVGQTLETTWD
jgi:hypothetical protein